MNFFVETIQVLLLSIWYNVQSFIHLFVPIKKKNISGELVLITGAGSGIGRLMALEFAALDTVLVLWDINQDGMKETARLAKQRGAKKVCMYLCDCSDKNEVYKVADQVRKAPSTEHTPASAQIELLSEHLCLGATEAVKVSPFLLSLIFYRLSFHQDQSSSPLLNSRFHWLTRAPN